MTSGVLSPRLAGRPVIWDREDDRRQESPSPRIQERAGRLSRALGAIGVIAGQRVVIMCCTRHTEDRQVAQAAAESLRAMISVPADWSQLTITRRPGDQGAPTVYLACEEGVAAWRAAQGTGIMIGDGPEVLWWKALECRYAAE